jgi:hypothetical protein
MKQVRLMALLSGTFTLLCSAAVDFKQQVQPILESACLSCHGPEKPKGDLRLDTRAGAIKGGGKGPAIGSPGWRRHTCRASPCPGR